ncbi:iron-siderophore ABC transporter substrate-binding protein [Zhihengliuella halotolerans]|uniref:iron-siderophore ABC transporter substrate-binding protein n=1 Tax=Zhihengliuella halotolerans TaxID=370736 RepID=UPI000C80DC64|nr:iron-siderophore ABC transporter substrate-binding protein [Zhihengliuella halotolerans]
MAFSRRAGLLAAAAATVLAASACSGAATGSSDSSEAATGAFPVTVDSIYGESVIPEQPERVVTVSWSNADTALALGVVPVGMPADAWGGGEDGTTAWVDDKLEELGAPLGSDGAPELYSEVDGVNFEAIAALEPDVILAGYSGLTKEEFDKLSKIAPVVGPQEENYQAPWQDVAKVTGEALGKPDEADQLVSDIESDFAAIAEDHPGIEDLTFIAANLDLAENTINVYAGGDTRQRLFETLGMTSAPVVEENTEEGAFFFEWSVERADELDSDILYTFIPEGNEMSDVTEDDLYSQIPAVANGGLVATRSNEETMSISAANVLGLPWALENVIPDFVETADGLIK